MYLCLCVEIDGFQHEKLFTYKKNHFMYATVLPTTNFNSHAKICKYDLNPIGCLEKPKTTAQIQ